MSKIKSKLPLISVIIPTFNRVNLIGETLDSLITQTYINWECIVVDDGSTDYTDELLEFYCKKDHRIQFHHRPAKHCKGANACRNYGFELSKGKYVKWLDSDDVLRPEHLNVFGGLFKNSFDLIIYDAAVFFSSMNHTDHYFINKTNSDCILIDYLTGRVNLNLASVVWSKKIVKNYKFNESLSRAQELDFHFRILINEGLKIKYISKVMVDIKSHRESLTGNYGDGFLLSLKSELKIRRKIVSFIVQSNYSVNDKKLVMRFYAKALSHLSRHRSIQDFVSELNKIEFYGNKRLQFFVWKLEILIFLIFYKLTQRDFQLKRRIEKFEDIFSSI